jgi:hypothetical protein
MNIRYTRSGGRTPPRDREILELNADGKFSMWRSVGSATHPPTPIGRFAGQLDGQDQTQVQQAAAKAAKAGNLKLTPPPGAATETIAVGEAQARLGANDKAEGDWSGLIEQLRRLLGDLTASPQAAIGLEVREGGQAARLVHRGSAELQLDLSGLTVRAVLWEGYNKNGDWRAKELPAGAASKVKAGPGWSFDLPFNHGFKIAAGQEAVAYVTFAAFDGERAIPVALNSPRSS